MFDNFMSEDIAATSVLSALGDNLLREAVLLEYDQTINPNLNRVSTIKRAIDFIIRVCTRVIAWFKKGYIKRQLNMLEFFATHKDVTKYTTNQFKGEELYTMFFNTKWYTNKVAGTIDKFFKSELSKRIIAGDLKLDHDRSDTMLNKYQNEMVKSSNELKLVFKEMRRLKLVNLEADHTRPFIQMYRNLNDEYYEYIVRAYDAAKIIKKTEIKEIGDENSKSVSQRIIQSLTLFGKNVLTCMEILQFSVSVLNGGVLKRTTSKKDKLIPKKNITVDEIKDELREIFNKFDDAKTTGVISNVFKVNGGYRIRLCYPTGVDGSGLFNWTERNLGTVELNDTVQRFLGITSGFSRTFSTSDVL